ncbi:citrate synthase [Sulfodiicoccus acidiphilus]|uniref:Citrate synthase n=1 Tax=Sulfodiicoccus acidiphilus TaxID=1670455 RepID=A0A348B466_9CREN|nr:citrate synthase [Sulfodiicoccus acidiphilus]BBD72968.1 citrate synthase [Sulfodiicoccus acidiphilus]GGT87647.1 citrate synthase [Sulfodiicoccus acidiphilus]
MSETEKAEVSRGLENVYIKATSLTYIDGERGILRYRGYDINDLANNATYEEVVHLMLYGELPNSEQLKRVKDVLNSSYEVPEDVLRVMEVLPKDSEPVALMEAGLAALATHEKEFKWKERDREKALEIIGKVSTITANVYRVKQGLTPRVPSPGESYAKSFLEATFSKSFTSQESSMMDKFLVLYADHEVPASTTAALVTASTLSDMYSCMVSAITALKGPLHGGAMEAAFRQFKEIGDPSKVDDWFERTIVKGGNRLMGFGHRVYRTYDPRGKIFKSMAEVAAQGEARKYLEIAEKLETLGVKHFESKKIYPNTDFYAGILMYGLGFPDFMFTPLFALSRTLGWLAHVVEYVDEQHRLIRPRALYVGPGKREFVPLNQRK